MIQVEPNIWVFYSGDLNQDESIYILVLPLLFNDNDNFAYGYYTTDLNGDATVDILDFPLQFNNSDNFIYSHHL